MRGNEQARQGWHLCSNQNRSVLAPSGAASAVEWTKYVAPDGAWDFCAADFYKDVAPLALPKIPQP
jgi:hypothetical protein